jgi:hypothetical protein
MKTEKFRLRGNNSVCAAAFQLLRGLSPAHLRGNLTGHLRPSLLFKVLIMQNCSHCYIWTVCIKQTAVYFTVTFYYQVTWQPRTYQKEIYLTDVEHRECNTFWHNLLNYIHEIKRDSAENFRYKYTLLYYTYVLCLVLRDQSKNFGWHLWMNRNETIINKQQISEHYFDSLYLQDFSLSFLYDILLMWHKLS